VSEPPAPEQVDRFAPDPRHFGVAAEPRGFERALARRDRRAHGRVGERAPDLDRHRRAEILAQPVPERGVRVLVAQRPRHRCSEIGAREPRVGREADLYAAAPARLVEREPRAFDVDAGEPQGRQALGALHEPQRIHRRGRHLGLSPRLREADRAGVASPQQRVQLAPEGGGRFARLEQRAPNLGRVELRPRHLGAAARPRARPRFQFGDEPFQPAEHVLPGAFAVAPAQQLERHACRFAPGVTRGAREIRGRRRGVQPARARSRARSPPSRSGNSAMTFAS